MANTYNELDPSGYTPEGIQEEWANLEDIGKDIPKIIKGVRANVGATSIKAGLGLAKSFISGIGTKVEQEAYDPTKHENFQHSLWGSSIKPDAVPPDTEKTKELFEFAKPIKKKAEEMFDWRIDIADQMLKEADPGFAKDSTSEFLYENMSSATNSLAIAGIGHISSGGLLTLPLMWAQKKGLEHDRLLKKGVPEQTAQAASDEFAWDEVIGEAASVAWLYGKIPLKFIDKAATGKLEALKPALKTITNGLHGYILGILGENATEALDRRVEAGLIDPNASVVDAIVSTINDPKFQKSILFQEALFAGVGVGGQSIKRGGESLLNKNINWLQTNETVQKISDYLVPSPEAMQQRREEEGVKVGKFQEGEINFWRGGTKKYPKFLEKYIGQGEGGAAFGWGINVSEEQDVAKKYAESRENESELDDILINGNKSNWMDDSSPYKIDVLRDLAASYSSKAFETKKNERIQKLQGYIDSLGLTKQDFEMAKVIDEDYEWSTYQDEIDALNKLQFGDVKYSGVDKAKLAKGKLFKGKERGKDYQIMPWDRTISAEQAKIIEQGLNKIPLKGIKESILKDVGTDVIEIPWYSGSGKEVYTHLVDYFWDIHKDTGNYNSQDDIETINITRPEAKMFASKWLDNIGIHGNEAPIGYLSRNRHNDTELHNYFIFNEKNVDIESWWDLAGNQIGNTRIFNDLVRHLLYNTDAKNPYRIIPTIGDDWDKAQAKEGQSARLQYKNGVPFEADILKVKEDDVFIDDGKQTILMPKKDLRVVRINGEHGRTTFTDTPFTAKDIEQNKDTLYVVVEALGKKFNLDKTNIGKINLNEIEKDYNELLKIFPDEKTQQVIKENKQAIDNFHKLSQYSAVERYIDNIKRQVVGTPPKIKTTFNVKANTYDNVDKYKSIDKEEGHNVGDIIQIASENLQPKIYEITKVSPSSFKGSSKYGLKKVDVQKYNKVVVYEETGNTNNVPLKANNPQLYKYLTRKLLEVTTFADNFFKDREQQKVQAEENKKIVKQPYAKIPKTVPAIPQRKFISKFPESPMGDIQSRDQEESDWIDQLNKRVGDERLLRPDKKIDMFNIFLTDITEAIKNKQRSKVQELIQEGVEKYMDIDKLSRLINNLDKNLGVAPHQMSLVEWFITNGADISMNRETSRGKYVTKEENEGLSQMGLEDSKGSKATTYRRSIPNGIAMLNGKYLLDRPFEELATEDEAMSEGRIEVEATGNTINDLKDRHLNSAVAAFENGDIDCLSDTAIRLFYEHPELFRTAYSKPYRDYLSAKVNETVKRGIESDAVFKVRQEKEKARLVAKDVARTSQISGEVLAAAQSNVELTDTMGFDEYSNLIEEKVTNDDIELEEAQNIGQKMMGAFMDVIGNEEGSTMFVNDIADWMRTPGNKHLLKSHELPVDGVNKQRYDTAMAVMRNNIDRLGDLANGAGYNTYEYFKAMLVKQGFNDNDAGLFAKTFTEESLPRLVLGAQEKAFQAMLVHSTDKRKRGYGVKDIAISGGEGFWNSIKDNWKYITDTRNDILAGSESTGSTPNAKTGLQYYPKIPAWARIFFRETISAIPNQIRDQEAVYRHILGHRLTIVEQKLAVEFIAAMAAREDVSQQLPYLYKLASKEGLEGKDAQHYVALKENEVYQRIQNIKKQIRARDKDSLRNIMDAVHKYKILSARSFDEQVRRGKVEADQKRQYYFHHQVVKYTEDWMIDRVSYNVSKISKLPVQHYLDPRQQGEHEFHKPTFDSLIASLMTPFVDNLIEDNVKELFAQADATLKYLDDNQTKDEDGNAIIEPESELDFVMNRDKDGNPTNWLKEGKRVLIDGTPHIAVCQTYYTLKFDHSEDQTTVNGNQRTYLIPESINSAINSLFHRSGRLVRTINLMVKNFKRLAIFGVWPLFQMNNMLGDILQLSLLAENRVDIIKHIPFAVKYSFKKWVEQIYPDLWREANFKYNEREIAAEDWLDRHGVIKATSIAEVRSEAKGWNPLSRFIKDLEITGEARENVLRVAFAMSLYDQMQYATEEQKESLLQKYSWVPHILEGNTTDARMASLARTLVTDYMRQTESYKKTISAGFFPFGHWFFENARMTARKWFFHLPIGSGAIHQSSLTGMLMIPAIFMAIWNNSDPEREKMERELPPNRQNKFHLNQVDKKTGSRNIYEPQLPTDVLPLANIPGLIVSNAIRRAKGEVTTEEAFKQFGVDIYSVNKEILFRLTNFLLRFGTGMITKQDPFDRAKILPREWKELTDTDKAMYTSLYFMKCGIPVAGNYLNRTYMKNDPDAFSNTFEAWKDGYRILGFKKDIPFPIGYWQETDVKKIWPMTLLNRESGQWVNEELPEKIGDIDKQTMSIRGTLLDALKKNTPSYPSSTKKIDQAFSTAEKKLRKLYPNDFEERLPEFMELLSNQYNTPTTLRVIITNEKNYYKKQGNDEMVLECNQMLQELGTLTYVETIKKLGKMAKAQMPYIIENIKRGTPSKNNVLENEWPEPPPPITTQQQDWPAPPPR
jgi:hypothetical protein